MIGWINRVMRGIELCGELVQIIDPENADTPTS